MTRIIAGEYGGRRLKTPGGDATRPTSDRAREAMFAALAAMGYLDEGPCLDIYAGSGAVGLEAVSRGAPHAYLVESASPALAVIRANVASLGLADQCTVIGRPAETVAGALRDIQATTVFCDPPYAVASDDVASILTDLLGVGAIERDAVVVIERAARDDWSWPPGFEPQRDRVYGAARLWYGRPL